MFDLAKEGPVIVIRLNKPARYEFLVSTLDNLRQIFDQKRPNIISEEQFKDQNVRANYFNVEKEFFKISCRIISLYLLAHIDYALHFLESLLSKNNGEKLKLLLESLHNGGSDFIKRIFQYHLPITQNEMEFAKFSKGLLAKYMKFKTDNSFNKIGIAVDEFHIFSNFCKGYFLHYDCRFASDFNLVQELVAKQLVERYNCAWATQYLTNSLFKRDTSILYILLYSMRDIYDTIPQYLASTSLSTIRFLLEPENFSRGDLVIKEFSSFYSFKVADLINFLNEHFSISQDQDTQSKLSESLSRFIGRGEWFFQNAIENVRFEFLFYVCQCDIIR